jgi:hypothetical protein
LPESAFYMKGSIDQVVEDVRGGKRADGGAKAEEQAGDEDGGEDQGNGGEDEGDTESESADTERATAQ